MRDVVRHCIHGVDRNPLAVELAKVALWIEARGAGQAAYLSRKQYPLRRQSDRRLRLSRCTEEKAFPTRLTSRSPVTTEAVARAYVAVTRRSERARARRAFRRISGTRRPFGAAPGAGREADETGRRRSRLRMRHCTVSKRPQARPDLKATLATPISQPFSCQKPVGAQTRADFGAAAHDRDNMSGCSSPAAALSPR